MRVKELIALLKSKDPEMEVTVAACEFGFISLESLSEVNVVQQPIPENTIKEYRHAVQPDGPAQMTVLCCGPSDPNYVDRDQFECALAPPQFTLHLVPNKRRVKRRDQG